MKRPIELAKANFEAYAANDRPAIEALLADDFHFTSPLDNRLDRAAYFKICWPNSKTIASFEYVSAAETEHQAFITYIGVAANGHRFRNTEVHTVRDEKIVEVEVYFGWNIPHEVPANTHRDPSDE